MDLSDWRVSFYPNSLLTLLWKIFWSKQAVQGKVLCATRGHCVCMSNGVIYSYAANSQNIFIIPWSWSYLTDDFSRGFFSGYVMIWSPNSKDHSSGNLLFLLLMSLCCLWAEVIQVEMILVVSQRFTYVYVSGLSYKRSVVMTAPSQIYFLVCTRIWNISEISRLEKTCLDVNTARGEWLKFVKKNLKWWTCCENLKVIQHLIVRQSGCLFQGCKALTLTSSCESEPTNVSRGHFLSEHPFLSCPYCPD